MNSSNGNNVASSSDPSDVETNAQLREAIGLLWRRVDQLETTSSKESQKIQEKLDTWIATNRSILESNQELIKVIVLNSQESRRSIESSERGSQLLTSLSEQLQQLEQVMTELQQISMQPNAPSTAPGLQAVNVQLQLIQASINQILQSDNSDSLKTQGTELQTTLSTVSQKLDTLQTSISKPPNPISTQRKQGNNKKVGAWNAKVWLSLGLQLVILIFLFLSNRQTDSIYRTLNSVLRRVERLEQR